MAGATEAMARAVRNVGRPGIAAMAISAVDIALWDLKARLLGCPLADLLGRARDEVPVYGSGGFTTYDDDRSPRPARAAGWTGPADPPGQDQDRRVLGRSERRDLARIALARR